VEHDVHRQALVGKHVERELRRVAALGAGDLGQGAAAPRRTRAGAGS